ncbi:MAG: hypothetical protein GXO22_07280 [Aquificae bacterium]|nr:hypothetical protein [Aquificota bacterium]
MPSITVEQLKRLLENPEKTRPRYIRIRSKKIPLLDWVIDLEKAKGLNINKALGIQVMIMTENGIMTGYDLEKSQFIKDLSPEDFRPTFTQEALPLLVLGLIAFLGYKALK